MVGDPGARYFRCSDGERAAFEAGIKLGALYHQFIGTPVAPATAAALEAAIEEATRLQPFVEAVEVRILRRPLRRALGAYGYAGLAPEMLRVRLRVRYGGAEARAEMRRIPGLAYPLMYLRCRRSPARRRR